MNILATTTLERIGSVLVDAMNSNSWPAVLFYFLAVLTAEIIWTIFITRLRFLSGSAMRALISIPTFLLMVLIGIFPLIRFFPWLAKAFLMIMSTAITVYLMESLLDKAGKGHGFTLSSDNSKTPAPEFHLPDIESIKKSIYDNTPRSVFYADRDEDLTLTGKTLDGEIIRVLKGISGVENINPGDSLYDDLCLDVLDIPDVFTDLEKENVVYYAHPNPFYSAIESYIKYLASDIDTIPGSNCTVASIIDLIARSKISDLKLSPAMKKTLRECPSSWLHNQFGEYKMRIMSFTDRQGYYITDPFVLICNPFKNDIEVANFFRSQVRCHSDHLFAAVVKEFGLVDAYVCRDKIDLGDYSLDEKLSQIKRYYNIYPEGKHGCYILHCSKQLAEDIANRFRNILVNDLGFEFLV